MIWDIMQLLKLVGVKSYQIAPMEQDHEQFEHRRCNYDKIPRRRFEIEGEAFMIAHDEEEPRTIQQDFSGPKSKEWIKAMEE